MRQSIIRSLLAALLGTAVFACHAPVHAQFRGREMAPANADRVPEALEKLVDEIEGQSLAKPPERDFKVDKGPAEQLKLFRADPKLLENKFSARVVLTVTTSFGMQPTTVPDAARDLRYNELSRAVHDLPQSVKRLIDGRQRISIFTGMDLSTLGQTLYSGQTISASEAIPTLSGYVKFLSELCPKEQLPPQAAIDFLTSVDCDRDVHWWNRSRPAQTNDPQTNERREWYITVYAPTDELAEQRARAILQLFDNGLCRPLQRDCLAEAKKSLEAARKGYQDVARQSQDIAAKQEVLDKPSEITADILTQLRAQKVMIGVELAGLEARIKACNGMLTQSNRDRQSEKVRESVADMKVRAEVELVGTKEKLDRINALISEGNDRSKLRQEVDRLLYTREKLQQQIERQHVRRAEAYARLVALYAPLELKDNQITISPVEWTN